MAIILTIQPSDDIQNYLDILDSYGGGILNLNPVDTFYPGDSVTISNNSVINGNGATIDFGGGAHSFNFSGTAVYSTGTISATLGDATITGSGTTWTSDMEGNSMLIGDFWYVIDTVTNATSIELDSPFMGEDLSGDTYQIAEIVSAGGINNLTIQNSTASGIIGQYVDGFNSDAVNVYSCDKGFNFSNSSNVGLTTLSTYDCTTWGIQMNNVPYVVLNNFGCLEGAGVSLTRVTNAGLGIASFQANTTVALSLTNCSNLGFVNYAVIGASTHGIEMVSGNSDIDLISGYFADIGGDGIKATATTDGVTMNNNSFKNYTGYGINIANANCDNNIIIANGFGGGGAGAVNNSGTGTLIRSNIGVADSV